MSDTCALVHPHEGLHRDDEGWVWSETVYAHRARHCPCASCRAWLNNRLGQQCPCPPCNGPAGPHQVLANRYRPQSLDELLGAEEFKRYARGGLAHVREQA